MSPKAAQAEANAVFKKSPISASLSGLWPRLIGVFGIFRGQGIGIAKAIVSLTLFHEGRIFITNQFKQHNLKKLEP